MALPDGWTFEDNSQPASQDQGNGLTFVPTQIANPVSAGNAAVYNLKQGMANAGVMAVDPQALSGAYTQGYSQAQGANIDVQKAQQQANIELAKDAQNRAENIKADLTKREQSFAVEQGQGPTPINLTAEESKKVAEYNNFFQSMQNLEGKYGQALKSPFFGGNFRGGGPLSGILGMTDDRIKQYHEATQLSGPDIANGILPYTAGADAKQAVMDKLDQVMPNSTDAFQSGSGKFLQMRQKGLYELQNMRDVLATQGKNVKPLDEAIAKWGPTVQENEKWYADTFQNPGSPYAHNSNNIMPSSQGDHLNQLIQGLHKPQTTQVANPAATP